MKNWKIFLIWGIAFWMLGPEVVSAQSAPGFAAEASAAKIGLKDQVQVSFLIQNAPNATNFEAPNFSGFRVLNGPFQSSQTSMRIINGQQSVSTTIRLTYLLQPQKTGSLTIQPAQIQIDGKTYHSAPIRIEVVNGSVRGQQGAASRSRDPFDDPFFQQDPFEAMRQQQQRMRQLMRQQMQRARQPRPDIDDMDEKNLHNNVFIKVTVDKTQPYVGEQITASYKLYTRLPMNMNLTQLPSLNGFWSEDFDIPDPPRAQREVINGKEYQVFLLKKSALFPQQPGKLVLDPAKAEGVVRVIEKTNPNPQSGTLFMDDPFFDDDFFSGYNYKDIHTKLSSDPVTIHVQPLPTANQPSGFTGAVGQFKVNTTLDSTVLSTDETGTFQLVVSGTGNLSLIGAPEVRFPEALGALDPVSTDTITSRTPEITGARTFTYRLSPRKPGKYTIPAIEFSWFDPQTKSYRSVKTQPLEITVEQGSNFEAAGDQLRDIHPLLTDQLPARERIGFVFVASPWYWSLFVVALVVFVVLVLIHRRKNAIRQNQQVWKTRRANKVAWKRLATARRLLHRSDTSAFYEEVSKAVWLYLSNKLSMPLATLSKDNITEKLKERSVPQDSIEKVHEVLSECELALYSRSGGQQQKEKTLQHASELIGALDPLLHPKK